MVSLSSSTVRPNGMDIERVSEISALSQMENTEMQDTNMMCTAVEADASNEQTLTDTVESFVVTERNESDVTAEAGPAASPEIKVTEYAPEVMNYMTALTESLKKRREPTKIVGRTTPTPLVFKFTRESPSSNSPMERHKSRVLNNFDKFPITS